MMGKNEEGIIDGGKKIGSKKDHRDRWDKSFREMDKGEERNECLRGERNESLRGERNESSKGERNECLREEMDKGGEG